MLTIYSAFKNTNINSSAKSAPLSKMLQMRSKISFCPNYVCTTRSNQVTLVVKCRYRELSQARLHLDVSEYRLLEVTFNLLWSVNSKDFPKSFWVLRFMKEIANISKILKYESGVVPAKFCTKFWRAAYTFNPKAISVSFSVMLKATLVKCPHTFQKAKNAKSKDIHTYNTSKKKPF